MIADVLCQMLGVCVRVRVYIHGFHFMVFMLECVCAYIASHLASAVTLWQSHGHVLVRCDSLGWAEIYSHRCQDSKVNDLYLRWLFGVFG